jgi:hypothetical protein
VGAGDHFDGWNQMIWKRQQMPRNDRSMIAEKNAEEEKGVRTPTTVNIKMVRLRIGLAVQGGGGFIQVDTFAQATQIVITVKVLEGCHTNT